MQVAIRPTLPVFQFKLRQTNMFKTTDNKSPPSANAQKKSEKRKRSSAMLSPGKQFAVTKSPTHPSQTTLPPSATNDCGLKIVRLVSNSPVSSSSVVTVAAVSEVSQQQQLELDFLQQEKEALALCGTCDEPLGQPPSTSLSNNTTTTTNASTLDHRVITCSNYIKEPKSCQTMVLNKERQSSARSFSSKRKKQTTKNGKHLLLLESPHFHLCCSTVPCNSQLYSNLQFDLDKKQESVANKKSAPSSNNSPASTSPIPPFNNHTGTNGKITTNISINNSAKTTVATAASTFLCPACDIKGTSMYLYEYFSNHHKLKCQFFSDDEAILSVQPVGCVKIADDACATANRGPTQSNQTNNTNKTNTELTISGMGEDNGYVKYLLDRKKQQQLPDSTLMCSNKSSQQFYKKTELRLDFIQNILDQIPSSSPSKQYNKRHDVDNHNDANAMRCGATIDSKWLAGQPIRLFCDTSNTYYTGRYVDSRWQIASCCFIHLVFTHAL